MKLALLESAKSGSPTRETKPFFVFTCKDLVLYIKISSTLKTMPSNSKKDKK
jgi:hypothetical protein